MASKKTSVWNDISIPGFTNIVNTKISRVKRFIWGTAILTCLAICIIQISERISFFLYSSVAVKVSVELNNLPKTPRITICSTLNNLDLELRNDPSYNQTQMLRAEFTSIWMRTECNYMHLLNMTAEESWKKREIVAKATKILIKSPTEELWYPLKFTYYRFMASSGPCVTYTINSDIGEYNSKKIILGFPDRFINPEWLGQYNIFFHEDKEPLIPEITKMDAILSGEITLNVLRASHFINLNTTQSPCISEDEYLKCRTECLKKDLQSAKISCKFPLTIDAHVPRKQCSNLEECKLGLNEIRNVLNYHNPTKCNCPRKCTNIIFAATTAPVGHGILNHVLLQISIPQSYRRVEEYVAYNVVALFCDIGGSLGLCLGLCLISVMELLQTIVFSATDYFKKKL